MRCDREDRKIRRALKREIEIPAEVMERVQATYHSLGGENREADRMQSAEAESLRWEVGAENVCVEVGAESGCRKTGAERAYGRSEQKAARREAGTEAAHRRAETKVSGESHPSKRRNRPRLTRYLLAAAFAALAGGTVYAIQTSWLGNRAENMKKIYETLRTEETTAVMDEERKEIREQTMKYYKTEAERYQKMAESSDKEQETFDLTELIGNSVVKEESYYDGTDFALVVSLNEVHYPVEYNFGPESDGFDQLWNPETLELELLEEQRKNEEISEEEYTSRKEAAEKGLENRKVSIEENLADYLARGAITEQEFASLKEIYEKDGTVGFISYTVDIGDHILMKDGTDLTYAPGRDSESRYFIEPYEEMPAQAKNLDALDVVLKIKKYKCCTYIDEEGVMYEDYPPVEPELVTVTLKNTAEIPDSTTNEKVVLNTIECEKCLYHANG